MRDVFSGYHPLINFIFFAFIFGFSMAFTNPVCLAIAFLTSFAYSLCLNAADGLKYMLTFLLPVVLFASVFNPLFSHPGMTILAYFPNGNPLTYESIIYGIGMGIMFAGFLGWFHCFNRVGTSDKFVYLFGRAIPALSLILSMALRFVPRLKAQLKVITNAQKCIGRDVSSGNVITRAKNGIAILSILVTWSLENAIDTADSMRSRGYGLKGRTAFSIYRFDKRDACLLAWICACGIYIMIGAVRGKIYWQYYPIIKGNVTGWYTWSIFIVYFMLCMTPVGIDLYEERRWRILQSEI